MPWNRIATAASLLALAGCATGEPTLTLEAQAKAGDPSAACQLVLHDLQTCVAARKEWLSRAASARPACMADPLPAAHRAYFSQAIETLDAPRERRELLEIIADGATVTSTALKLNIGTEDQFDPLIDIIADSCATLRRQTSN